MLQLIDDMPKHAVGVRATGEVTREDIETVLIPALDALVAKEDALYYMLVLNTKIANWDLGAWLSDIKAGLKYLSKWKKMAIVTDEESVQRFTDLFSRIAPGEARGYPLDRQEEAEAWLAEPVKA